MKIIADIDEERIAELVENEIVKQILEKGSSENRIARVGVQQGVEKAVKEYIYSNKVEIIERVVRQATIEIVKKGLPKLLAELGKGETDVH